ncbi:MAG: hypothetical protein GXY08_01590 [Ruminococcus sp.]|nr:hypothetical protein [Ruminococcus sp.]
MKHTVTFLLMLALILSFGYYSAGFSELSFRNEEKKSIQVSRDDVNIDTVKFSGSESGFDPMSIIEPDPSPVKDFYYHLNTDFAAAYAAVFSQYDDKNYYLKGVETPIENAMQVSKNGYVYLSDYRYLNKSGEERCLDCIMTSYQNDFKLIYIRFRAPNETVADSKQAKKALDRINSTYEEASDENYKFEEYLFNIQEHVFPNDIESDYTLYVLSKYTDFESVYNRLDYLTSLSSDVQMPSNPFLYFWVNSIKTVSNEFGYNYINNGSEEYYEESRSIFGTLHIVDTLTYFKPQGEPHYTVSGNSILQTISYRQKELIMIYSITDGNIEGFFSQNTGGSI